MISLSGRTVKWASISSGVAAVVTLSAFLGALDVIGGYLPVTHRGLAATVTQVDSRTKAAIEETSQRFDKQVAQAQGEFKGGMDRVSREMLESRIGTLEFQILQNQGELLGVDKAVDANPADFASRQYRSVLSAAIDSDQAELRVLRCRLDRMNGIDRVC